MAITAERLMQPMRFRVDVRNGLIQSAQYTALMKGDKNANRVIVEIVDDGELVDLTGVLAEGSFIRPPDDARIKLPGTTSGSEAIIIIEEACYRESGGYQLDVELSIGETRRTVLSITGNVLAKGSGAILDVSGVIPSVDDIVAQYAEMKRVTEETKAARDEALTARDEALSAAENAGFKILGRYDTYAQMAAAHPTGKAGDAYAVGSENENEIYVWGVDALAWVNIGPMRGPKGEDGTMQFEDLTEEQKESLRGPAGKDGQDGRTPVKGTDYWTAADKTGIVNDVLAALPNASGVNF